ncbi:MAG: hypothetical protein J07HB67_02348 [halophilic archaeon J07HB67]|nr:MAG: hypothetical protein J07HB67_02348 [halophilic archaeon J07HB67]
MSRCHSRGPSAGLICGQSVAPSITHGSVPGSVGVRRDGCLRADRRRSDHCRHRSGRRLCRLAVVWRGTGDDRAGVDRVGSPGRGRRRRARRVGHRRRRGSGTSQPTGCGRTRVRDTPVSGAGRARCGRRHRRCRHRARVRRGCHGRCGRSPPRRRAGHLRWATRRVGLGVGTPDG